MSALAIVLLLSAAPANEPTALARMTSLCASHHAVPPRVLRALDDDDVAALIAIARDEERPLFERVRAVGLAGVRPTAEVRAMWRELRASRERELRVQAAYAQGLAAKGDERARHVTLLLDDDDDALREVGTRLLVTLPAARARAIAPGR